MRRDTERRLILFDVDGTLVDSMRIDGLCFVRALREVFGIERIDTDWTTYPDTTDSAIVGHVLQRGRGRGPSTEETGRLKDVFVNLLDDAITADPSVCRPVPGGPELIARLVDSGDHAIGIATGGWEESARLKLTRAGYDMAGIPLASSNDASTRVEILVHSADLVRSVHGSADFKSTTYVGDGVWDLRAASTLGYQFVGVASNADSGLRDKGCRLITDFCDHAGFLEVIGFDEDTR